MKNLVVYQFEKKIFSGTLRSNQQCLLCLARSIAGRIVAIKHKEILKLVHDSKFTVLGYSATGRIS
jgi:hypothetical protein